MATHAYMDRPEWVILAAQIRDEVVLFASKDLTRVELERRFEGTFQFSEPHLPLHRTTLTCEMGTYFMVTGHDYPDALTQLARVFEGLPAGRLGLPSGHG